MTGLLDSHCHIHSANYELDPDEAIKQAVSSGVSKIICVGTNARDSLRVVKFVSSRPNCWAVVGLHPHDAKKGELELIKIENLTQQKKVVAIGECGLDYHYNHSKRNDQIVVLRAQLKIALNHKLPLVFHVREAFEDYWSILDEFKVTNGVIHSFSGSSNDLNQALSRGLFIGLNGIVTFTKDIEQLELAKHIPLEKLLIETDSPHLTPVPYRGKVNEPRYVSLIAKFLANLRQEPVERLIEATTQNATRLFKL
jgi:TatD DNase family protein